MGKNFSKGLKKEVIRHVINLYNGLFKVIGWSTY